MIKTTRATHPMARHIPIGVKSKAAASSPSAWKKNAKGATANQIWLSKIIIISTPPKVFADSYVPNYHRETKISASHMVN
jgi:hypothetical protein